MREAVNGDYSRAPDFVVTIPCLYWSTSINEGSNIILITQVTITIYNIQHGNTLYTIIRLRLTQRLRDLSGSTYRSLDRLLSRSEHKMNFNHMPSFNQSNAVLTLATNNQCNFLIQFPYTMLPALFF